MFSLAQGSWLALGGSTHDTALLWMCHHRHCHHPWLTLGTAGTQLGIPGCLASLIHDPTPASHGNSGLVTAAGCVSPHLPKQGVLPKPSPSSPLCSSQGSCGSLCHQQHSWTSQDKQSCSNCSPIPQPCPAQPNRQEISRAGTAAVVSLISLAAGADAKAEHPLDPTSAEGGRACGTGTAQPGSPSSCTAIEKEWL